MKLPRNIIRIDQDASRTHAWRVTLQRKGVITIKHFSDGVHGGKQEALDAAIAYLDTLKNEEIQAEHLHWVCTRLRKNNTSGIPGVGRYDVLDNPRTGYRAIFWMASWANEHGVSRQRKFYVSCYGEEQAKRLAIVERERQLRRVCEIKGEQVC